MRSALTLALLLCATRAFADPKTEAKKHVEKAMKAHADGKFEDALGELTLAYSLDPQPNLLYAIGQVHVKLGHCTEAIDFYERFLASKPAAGPAAEANQAITTCQQHATVEPPPPPKEPPKVVDPAPPPPPPPPPPPAVVVHRAFYTDVVGDALVGAGVVAGVIGIVEYTGARSDLDSADQATTYGAHQQLVDDASSKRTLSIVFGAAGGALVIGGIVRYVVHDRTETNHGIAVLPTTTGGFVSWSERF